MSSKLFGQPKIVVMRREGRRERRHRKALMAKELYLYYKPSSNISVVPAKKLWKTNKLMERYQRYVSMSKDEICKSVARRNLMRKLYSLGWIVGHVMNTRQDVYAQLIYTGE